jgi:hypothetical protein
LLLRFLAVPLWAEDGAGFPERGGDCANPGTHTGRARRHKRRKRTANASEAKLMKSLIDLLYVYVLLPYELYVQGG